MSEMLEIKFNEKSNSYEICYDGFSCVNDGKKSYVSVCRKNGSKETVKKLPFNSAEVIKTEYQKNKIVTKYSDFCVKGKKLPFTLVCTAEISRVLLGYTHCISLLGLLRQVFTNSVA